MDAPVIYHLTTLQEWEEAQDKGSYVPPSLQREGFIHCSTEAQVDTVMRKHFQQHENLVKLIIDPSRLMERLQFDKVNDGQEEYPHIYGPLNLQAVTQIVFLDPITSEEG